MRMAYVDYSTTSYIIHVIKGLPSGYNQMRQMLAMLGVLERTVLLAPEVGEDYKAVAATVQANPMAVLLNSGCSHHLMGTKEAFVDMESSGDVSHVRGFNGALQVVQGRGTVALQGEVGKHILIPDVFYVPGVQANLLLADHLKDNGVKLQEDSNEMMLISTAGDVLGRARYSGRVLCTDLRPLVHFGIKTIKILAKHEVATGLDVKPSAGADLPCVSCIGGKLAQHTFPEKGSNVDEALAVVHIDLCRSFQEASKDGSICSLLLKDKKKLVLSADQECPSSNVAGKLASNAQWGLHLGVLQESKSWEVLDLTDNKDITTVEGIFYEPLLLEVWKIRYGPASGRTHANLPMDSSMATSSPSASPPVIDLPSMTSSPSPSPHIINLPRRGHMSATGDEGRLGVSLMASARGIASGQHDDTQVGVGGKPLTKKEQ
ncbi:unnamed protein product [Closterium sp. NIES-53]